MKMKSNCPINFGLEHFGDKWSLLVLRDLIFKEKRHYNEFLDADEKISTKVLSDKLNLLQEGGIITKSQDQIKKSRFRYSLTEKGISMVPFMIELILWGIKFDPDKKEVDYLDKLKKSDKSEFASALQVKLRKSHLQGS